MSASDLYDAIHGTIAECVAADDCDLSTFELIGVLEQVKHDVLNAGDLDDDIADELAA